MKRAGFYRRFAHEACDYNIGTLALIYFLLSIISGVVSAYTYGVGALLITGPLTMGFACAIVRNYHYQKVDVGNLFDGFKNFVHNFVLYLLQAIYTLLWALLFIIPGIIKAYAYSMAYFVSIDNPELNPDQCITRSKELMKGKKWKLFWLEFTYIGWIFLCVLTLGILTFWVIPRMQTARYAFYCDIVGKPQYLEEAAAEVTVEAKDEEAK